MQEVSAAGTASPAAVNAEADKNSRRFMLRLDLDAAGNVKLGNKGKPMTSAAEK